MKRNVAQLVKKSLNGDIKSFGELVEEYRQNVHAFCYHRIGDFQDAQDLVQEIFLKVYLSLNQLRDPGKFSGWLYRMAINSCNRWWRKRSEKTLSLEDPDKLQDTSPSIYEGYQRKELESKIKEALSQLSENNRLVITLRYLGGRSYNEIADFLNLPLTTVKSRVHEGRKQLKKELINVVRKFLRKKRLSEEFIEQMIVKCHEKCKCRSILTS
jgi:RNA polymerase sigma-70 factor (ECF subfamily)